MWKMTFTHLTRILSAQGGESLQVLNERYIFLSCTCFHRSDSHDPGDIDLCHRSVEGQSDISMPMRPL